MTIGIKNQNLQFRNFGCELEAVNDEWNAPSFAWMRNGLWMSETEVLAEFDGEVVDRCTTCWYLLLSQTASSNVLKQVMITWNT